MLFQCRASIADGCPPLNQPCMFTMISSTFYVLDLTIEGARTKPRLRQLFSYLYDCSSIIDSALIAFEGDRGGGIFMSFSCRLNALHVG